MNRNLLIWILVCSIQCGVFAQEVDYRSAIEAAASFLETQAQAENANGWFDPPKINRVVVDTNEVEVRYSKKEVPQAIYEWETKEVRGKISSGSSTDAGAGLGTRTIKIRGKKIGEKMVVREVRDPNGDIVKTHRRPIYGPGGPDIWRNNMIGNNALAIYALNAVGREDGEVVAREKLDYLYGIFDNFGMPDVTWDLAWSVCAFATTGDELDLEMARRLAAKLMAGQIESGQAAGLWGPVSFNPRLLSANISTALDANEALKEASAKAKNSTSRSDFDAVTAAQSDANAARDRFFLYSWFGDVAGFNSRRSFAGDNEDGIVHPAPYHLRINQRPADMESTLLALYALRIAAEAGALPDSGPEPPPAVRRGRAEAGIDLRTVLLRAASAIGRSGQQGVFSPANYYVPVSDFDKHKLPGTPVQPASFPQLNNAPSLTSTAQGLAALTQVGRIAGLDSLRSYAQQMVAARAVLEQELEAAVAGTSEHLGSGGLGIMSFYFALSDPGPDELPTAKKPVRALTAQALIKKQKEDGSFADERKGALPYVGTALLEAWQVLPYLAVQKNPHGHVSLDPLYLKAHMTRPRDTLAHRLKNNTQGTTDTAYTALAMLVLLEAERHQEASASTED